MYWYDVFLYMKTYISVYHEWASLVAQTVNNPSAMQKIRVRSLGQEEPLEKGMATHSSILTWEIPWIWEPVGLQSVGLQRVRHDLVTNTSTFHFQTLQLLLDVMA